MIEILKRKEPKITKIIVRCGNQVNLGAYNLWKGDITAEVEITEGEDVAAVIKATQLKLCKALINKETATAITNKTKDGFK